MTSEDDPLSKKINMKQPKLFLRRSASTTGIGMLCPNHLYLREAKSCAGNIQDVKSSSSIDHDQNINDEEICNRDINNTGARFIETRDTATNKIVKIKDDILNFRGKKYSLFDIAYKWKKDCRIWLWKNSNDYKKNRSVAEIN